MRRTTEILVNGFVLLLFSAALNAQDQQPGDLRLLDWKPESQLVVSETRIDKPRFPVIDVHNHLGDLDRTEEYLAEMDAAGVWAVVSLDGNSRDEFYKKHLEASLGMDPDRFIVFFRPDFGGIDDPGWASREVGRLEDAVRRGARGLKISKTLGLGARDNNGNLLEVDDPRIDPIWAKCGELGIPVMIHVSDPKAFFTPLDEFNERYDELGAHPNWSFYGPEWPSKEDILSARNRVFARHPDTIFIGAHMGTLPEDLGTVSMWLQMYPNFYVDIDARISDLGRQPYTARKFFIEHQDRIMFGTDTAPNAEAYRIYFRFLETDDEYFNPARSHAQQGRWMIYGIHLPDEVLEKVYNKNALEIFAQFKG